MGMVPGRKLQGTNLPPFHARDADKGGSRLVEEEVRSPGWLGERIDYWSETADEHEQVGV